MVAATIIPTTVLERPPITKFKHRIPLIPYLISLFYIFIRIYLHFYLRVNLWLIDWFKVEKTKTRIFQQVPGGHIAFHHDWDNQRLNFDSSELTVRIWVQLDGDDCTYRLSNGDVDVTFSLQRGQFIVLNTDTVFHETWNHGSKPRNLLNITCRANSWLKNMNEVWRDPQTIKTMERSLGIN